MTILIPLAIGAGIGLAVALGASDGGDKPVTNLADAWAASRQQQAAADDAAFAVEPAAGPEPLVEGVQVRSLGGAPAESAVDVSLLRYLAARGDRAAVEAEIARLRALHPEWEPPADLFGPGRPVVDVTPLWQLYEKRDYAGVRAAIARIQADNADWQPPANLLQLMETNETRAALEQAAKGARWSEIVEMARSKPQQFDCGRIDNIWRLAEAQARTGDREGAAATYARVVRDCDDADHRFATLQKAKANVEAATARVARYKDMLRSKSVGVQDYDDAVAAARQTMAEVSIAEAELEHASIELKRTVVRSPITGRIGKSHVTKGALVTASQAEPLATIQRLAS